MFKKLLNLNNIKQTRNFVTIIKQQELGVKLGFGKFISIVEPGLRLNIPIYHKIHHVNMSDMILNIPQQSLISKDNITFTIDGSVQYKITDPKKAVLNVYNLYHMLPERCQMSMRQILSSLEVNSILHGLKDVPNLIKKSLSSIENDWGIEIGNVQIRDIKFDETIKRAMAVKAEAERNAEAKLINANADLQTAEVYNKAAAIYKENPITLRLREFQLFHNISKNPGSLICMVPSNVLDFPKSSELLKLLKKEELK
jgi:regulator of protease activity HflC (stomatin/prohibitin superfamily)